MQVLVNGQELTIQGSCSVRELLEQRGLRGAVCAVEVNESLVPKPRHEEHALADGDRVEIVTLVGGG